MLLLHFRDRPDEFDDACKTKSGTCREFLIDTFAENKDGAGDVLHPNSRRIPRSSKSWGGMCVRLCLNALFVWGSFLYCAMIWIDGRGTYDRNIVCWKHHVWPWAVRD